MPMRHGLTLGELGHWFIDHFALDVDYRVIAMEGWQPDAAPGFGWPRGPRVDQSQPQCPQRQHGARLCRHGDARGHDAVRGPGHDPPARSCSARPISTRRRVIAEMQRLGAAMACRLHAARHLVRADLPQACRQAVQRRSYPRRRPLLRPRRVQAVAGAGAGVQGDPPRSIPTTICGATFPTNMRSDKLAIDVINGGPALREWVDDAASAPADLDRLAACRRTRLDRGDPPIRLY